MTFARYVLLFVIGLAVLLGVSAYVHLRAAQILNLDRPRRWVLAGLIASGFAAALCARLLSRVLPASLLARLGLYGYVIVLAALVSAVLLGGVDLVRAVSRVRWFAAKALRRPALPDATGAALVIAAPAQAGPAPAPDAPPARSDAEHAAPSEPPVAAPVLPRRIFLAQAATGSALLIGSGSSAYGALFGRHDYEIEELTIAIPGLSPRLEGYCLVQLSDIHLGLFVGEPEMRAAEQLVKKARPDVIVLTGDLVDYDPRYTDMLGRFARTLSGLARDGVVAIPGNHDYFTGIRETLSALERGGATVLRNRGRVLGDAGGAFSLLGVDDVWAARLGPSTGPDIDLALRSVPPDLPRILLCHNPSYFPEAAGKVDLQLSGHTHGGQFNLLVRPADWLLPYGYVAGLYEREGSKLYVNRGFGTAGPPIRMGSPPEVTRIVLTSA
jgi:hypothetical protein